MGQKALVRRSARWSPSQPAGFLAEVTVKRAFNNDRKLLSMHSGDIYSTDSVKTVSQLYKLYDDDIYRNLGAEGAQT